MKYILLFIFISNFSLASVDFESRDYVVYVNNLLKIEYKRFDPSFNELIEENRPSISSSSPNENLDTVTYALHGYMGSPYEMTHVLKNAANRGEVIFNDLIIGYGVNSKITNQVKKELYYKHMEKNLNFLFAKFSKVNLIGFSTGGLLITKYLLEHPHNLKKVNKLRLISPYYFPHFSFAPSLGKILVKFKNTLDVNWFYKLTSFPDVEVLLLAPKNFLQEIPMLAALEIAELSDEVSNNFRKISELQNVEVFLTKEDMVLNVDKTNEFIPKIFPNAKINIFEGKGYPHHLGAPLVSKAADQIMQSL